jgi:riboflavin synthase
MFTGIIEAQGKVIAIHKEGENKSFIIQSPISSQLKIDQSLSHNGVCLTVTELKDDLHTVTAIKETLHRSNLGKIKEGDSINLERAMLINSRLDGHLVQGHVDSTGICIDKKEEGGSWLFYFSYEAGEDKLLVQKGSICINGVSLTVINPTDSEFAVAIIAYTLENTNFKNLQAGDFVNLEFDIIGKYISRIYKERI